MGLGFRVYEFLGFRDLRFAVTSVILKLVT